MNKIALNITILEPKLGTAELKVAKYIQNTPENVIPLSISQLAKLCNTSEATVTRLSKKLGYEGYQQLKIAIVKETDSSPISKGISFADSPFDIYEKMCNDIYCSLEKTKSVLNKASLLSVCNKLINAKEILVFGLGNSSSVANDLAHKLLRLGLNTKVYTDNHLQSISASHVNENSVVIGISHSGSSKDIVRALQLSKSNNATTVGITNYGKSPIYRVCDYILNTVSDETNYTILGLNSRIAQLAIVDTIYSYLVCHLKNAKEAIHKTEEALQSKKY